MWKIKGKNLDLRESWFLHSDITRLLRNGNKLSRTSPTFAAKILDEGSLGVDWPLIRSKGLLIQEFLMVDLLPRGGAFSLAKENAVD